MTPFHAQKILETIGYELVADGSNSQAAIAALMDFQRQRGMPPSGTLDAKTISALESVAETAVPYQGPSPNDPGASDERTGVPLLYVVLGALGAGVLGFITGKVWSEGSSKDSPQRTLGTSTAKRRLQIKSRSLSQSRRA